MIPSLEISRILVKKFFRAGSVPLSTKRTIWEQEPPRIFEAYPLEKDAFPRIWQAHANVELSLFIITETLALTLEANFLCPGFFTQFPLLPGHSRLLAQTPRSVNIQKWVLDNPFFRAPVLTGTFLDGPSLKYWQTRILTAEASEKAYFRPSWVPPRRDC